MQMGFNNDVEHLGLTLHVQTEDQGMVARKITSQVFFAGVILEARTLAYAPAVEQAATAEEREELVRKQMRTMHKAFFKRIQEGHYDARLRVAAPADPTDAEDAASDGKE